MSEELQHLFKFHQRATAILVLAQSHIIINYLLDFATPSTVDPSPSRAPISNRSRDKESKDKTKHKKKLT